ncbi:UBA/TS-N domain containing protein [Histomonas meleagridis]|uniref:UBA/TS-N domain containing protein n=1 Tax=Histomonas meleagridis TaxID=135588 RepID=UPI00355AB396|nr:UBA/TS-N domain containing protein [Histomonas meleagridis]KAH0797331.1 UBA/TS-N domain containing protein [Histomonas meleagridis]
MNSQDGDGEEITISDDSACDFVYEEDDNDKNIYGRIEEYINSASIYIPSFEYKYIKNGLFYISVPTSVLPLSIRKVNFDQIQNLVTIHITLSKGDNPLRQEPISITLDSEGQKNFLGKTLLQSHLKTFFSEDYNPRTRKLRSKSLLLNPSIFLYEHRPDSSKLDELISMGFDRTLSEFALLQTRNDLESSIELLLSDSVFPLFDITYISYEESPLVYLSIEIIDSFLDLVDHCCICGKELEFNGIKPVVCSSPLCYFSFVNIGVGANLIQEIRRDPTATDLIVSIASYAAGTSYMMPHPDANEIELQNFFNDLPTIQRILQTKNDQELYSLLGKTNFEILRFIMLANRSHLITLKGHNRLSELNSVDYQFLITSAPPEKEVELNRLKTKYGQIWLWHGSPTDRWYSIFHNGLKDYANTKWQSHDGHWKGIPGVYESDEFSYSYSYSLGNSMSLGNKYKNSMLPKNFIIVALVENAKMPDLRFVMNNEYAQKNEKALIPRVLMLVSTMDTARNLNAKWNTMKKPPKHVPDLEEIIGVPKMIIDENVLC